MIRLLIANYVEADAETMVEDMVEALVFDNDAFDYPSWLRHWHGN